MNGGPNADERLAAAFRAAADTPPEAGFSADDVRRESHRIGRRNRNLLVGGVAAAAIVLAGGVSTGVLLARSGGETSAAAPASDAGARSLGAPEMAREAPAVPPTPVGVPLGPAAGDCVNPQDPELRAVVDEVLPEVATASPAPTTMICRPGGGREVNLQVADGELTGLFSVVYTAPGEEPSQTASAVGWATAEVSTASGGLVTVTSRAESDSGGVPFGDRVPEIASALAPHL
ncbi:hypothetical protein [Pseudonocardia oroxyli]|uniref:Uncharacterized protein n=1 Tax=Pseudonocardia oroxyli TaxID=366584 RepID=A0A1G7UMS2_PSEOR|nr:hypothetical protein [Pseudonocardia oroxyli]SDG48905.1 hypothetical protein SAMN05216377_11297 [Pseudonocardia oroxyli]